MIQTPTIDQLRIHLTVLAEAYAQATGLSLTSIGLYALKDGKFFGRISAGGKFGLDTYHRAVMYFASSDKWNATKHWPRAVPRPLPGATDGKKNESPKDHQDQRKDAPKAKGVGKEGTAARRRRATASQE